MYRVQYPNSATRTTRIFALDQAAAEAMYAITDDLWDNAHFLTVLGNGKITADTNSYNVPISHPDGTPANLDAELAGADVVVLLATNGSSEAAAEVIARECFDRKIMCAGLALKRGPSSESMDRVVNSMRRFTRVLVVAQDDDYIPAMLTALRA